MDELFCKLADILKTVLPKDWEKIFLYSEISDCAYDICFYCSIHGKSGYFQCYDLEQFQISNDSVSNAFENVYKILLPFWLEKPENERWSNCTFVLDSDRNFKLDLDYTDLLDVAFEYRENWKKKYLV